MPADFVHLHTHSDYSLLDGACSVSGLLETCKELDMPAVAVTDHGVMGGAIEMYQTFAGSGVKPIIGCETYVSPTTRFDKDNLNEDIRGFHLLLLAMDIEGYKSLCKLLSEANLHGMYYKPRVDKELLVQYNAGLIASSACIGGEIAKNILRGNPDGAEKALKDYLDIFGRENFYLELMDHGLEEERIVNRALIEMAKKHELQLIATNDAHYLKKEHAASHDAMLCIQTQSKIDDERRMSFSNDEFYLKSPAEMKELFKEVPEAVSNTVAVAERCNLEFKFAPEVNHYPVYEIKDSKLGEKAYLRSICCEGIKKRYDFDPEQDNLTEDQRGIIERMDYELETIDASNYCSYFLVVWDFLSHARKTGVPVGPGRGSGAGSIVAYLTNITDIEPLRYGLLFERFLNPERVSPPDFDIDFCERRRAEVIEYVRDKYGEDSVAQIGTYGTLKAKAVIKDVARVKGLTFAEGDKITKLIPNDPKMTLDKALKESKELRQLMESESYVQDIFELARPLEGLNRNMSIHAAGVIIGDQRLDNLVPLARGAGNETITQFPAVPCEDLGLLKMDFLGLRTLTIIQDTVNNIKKYHNIDIDISKLPLDDPETFKLLNRGDTVGVFQLESGGMQNLCRQLGIECIEHIIALVAMYRPGPMQFIPDFIARKNGATRIEYDHPKMEKYLAETYGIMVYQEQIMQVVQVLAGFSLGGADILRRAIGKKKVKALEKQKEKFVAGCEKTSNINKKLAEQIWEKIEKFAGYGFNKSHSAAYAFLSYQTAYLKANYPVEFMTAVLDSEIDKADKIAFFISECSEMGIDILPPDVNAGDIRFAVDGKAIRFGLGAIKGVGETAADKIIETRAASGKFDSFLDFCERCGAALNSRMVEHLIKAGALDSLGLKRSQLLATAEATMTLAQSQAQDKANGQGSLFDMLDDSEQQEIMSVTVPDIPELEENELLGYEKELLGFYVTGHPLSKYLDVIKTYSTCLLRAVPDLPDTTGLRIGGIIKNLQRKFSKNNGKAYAILTLEDLEGVCECMIYGKKLDDLDAMDFDLSEGAAVLIEATASRRDSDDKSRLVLENIVPLGMAKELFTEELHLHIYENSDQLDIKRLRELCINNPGKSKVILCVSCRDGEIAFIESHGKFNVKATDSLLSQIKDILGERRFKLKADNNLPVAKPRYRPKAQT